LFSLRHAYYLAKARVTEAGHWREVAWQRDCSSVPLTESRFLCESAWVVLCSGFREAVVRKHFPAVSEAFHNWEDATVIAHDADRCFARACKVFGHRGKIRALIDIAQHVSEHGFSDVMNRARERGAASFCCLPYIGPATSLHLAKNLGLDVAKPDRHLLRIAAIVGFSSPEELCRTISRETGDPTAVVDIVLWRFATIEKRYVHHFGAVARMGQPSLLQQLALVG
jgi:hypothetical protein